MTVSVIRDQVVVVVVFFFSTCYLFFILTKMGTPRSNRRLRRTKKQKNKQTNKQKQTKKKKQKRRSGMRVVRGIFVNRKLHAYLNTRVQITSKLNEKVV